MILQFPSSVVTASKLRSNSHAARNARIESAKPVGHGARITDPIVLNELNIIGTAQAIALLAPVLVWAMNYYGEKNHDQR